MTISDWVSVTERMPKKRGDYLCWCPDVLARDGWPGIEARAVVLKFTGKRFITSFLISDWQPIAPPA